MTVENKKMSPAKNLRVRTGLRAGLKRGLDNIQEVAGQDTKSV